MHDGLRASDPMHIWLLHYLFLDAINEDALEWVDAWNSHVMQIKGEYLVWSMCIVCRSYWTCR